MTDRYNALTVTLERDMRDDDAEGLIAAILCMRGVIGVTGHVARIEDHVAAERARDELRKALRDILWPGVF